MSGLSIDLVAQKVIEYIEGTKEFAIEHASDVCKEMLLKAEIEAKANIVAGLLVALIAGGFGCFLLYKGFTFVPDPHHYSDATGWYVGGGVVTGGAFMSTFTCLFDGISSLIFVRNCPKLFLLEEFRRLVK